MKNTKRRIVGLLIVLALAGAASAAEDKEKLRQELGQLQVDGERAKAQIRLATNFIGYWDAEYKDLLERDLPALAVLALQNKLKWIGKRGEYEGRLRQIEARIAVIKGLLD